MKTDLIIEKLQNYPIDSNCYLLSTREHSTCIVVDPAQEEGAALYAYLVEKKLEPDYIILTHEHFDHISSVEYLRARYKCKVIATSICSESIGNPKKNLSLFHDQVGFSCSSADIIVTENNFALKWEGLDIKFYLTPGHSEGGLCFSINNSLFTGDTLMEAYKTPIKLPGGNKIKLKESIEMVHGLFSNTTTIYPGHGPSFELSKNNINAYNQ